MTGAGLSRRAVIAGGPAAAALAGCARREPAGALRFWAMGYEGDYAPHLAADFTRRTGIPVSCQSLPWTAAHEKLLTAFAGGSLPDVMMLPNGWVGEFAMIGALAPPRLPDVAGDMFPGVLDTVRYAGQPWAVPWSVSPHMQWFRRDMLGDAPPADWESWRNAGLRLKRRGGDGWFVLMFLNWWDALFSFAYQAGARVLRERDTRGDFDTPEFREALAFYKSLFDLGLAPLAQSTEVSDPFGAWAQGLFAIYPNGPTLLTQLKPEGVGSRAKEMPPGSWGVARLPGPRGPGQVSATSGSVAVSAQSPRPALAQALLAHMTSARSELRFQRMIGNLPARRSAWADPQLAQPMLAPFRAQLADPAPQPQLVEWERVRIETQLVAERVVRGSLTFDAGIAEMNRRADELLARRRALVQAGRVA